MLNLFHTLFSLKFKLFNSLKILLYDVTVNFKIAQLHD